MSLLTKLIKQIPKETLRIKFVIGNISYSSGSRGVGAEGPGLSFYAQSPGGKQTAGNIRTGRFLYIFEGSTFSRARKLAAAAAAYFNAQELGDGRKVRALIEDPMISRTSTP